MYILISVIILVLCVLLSIVILVQNPKGGGLTQSLGGVSSQVFGAKNSAGLIEKITWYLAIAIVVLSISSVMFIDSAGGTSTKPKSDAELLNESGKFNQTQPVSTTPLPGTEMPAMQPAADPASAPAQ